MRQAGRAGNAGPVLHVDLRAFVPDNLDNCHFTASREQDRSVGSRDDRGSVPGREGPARKELFLDLLGRARGFFKGLASPPVDRVQRFSVICPLGHRLTGQRTEGYQALRCPACGEGVFVLPASPLPEPVAPPRPAPARTAVTGRAGSTKGRSSSGTTPRSRWITPNPMTWPTMSRSSGTMSRRDSVSRSPESRSPGQIGRRVRPRQLAPPPNGLETRPAAAPNQGGEPTSTPSQETRGPGR